MDWIIPLRWLHVFAASAWFGEVVVINFILVPALTRFQGEARKQFLATVFPKVFRLASVLSATTAITGGVLLWRYTGGSLSALGGSRWGTCLTIGASMGLVLTLFHFFMEDKLARRVGIGCPDTSMDTVNDVHAKLTLVPRLGLGVITTIFFLMMYAVRGA